MDTPRVAYTIEVPVPAATDGADATRQRASVEHAVRALQALVTVLSPEELDLVATRIEQVLQPVSAASAEKTALARSLAGGADIPADEALAQEMTSLIDYFQFRRELLAGSLTAAQVAKLLDLPQQAVADRVARGRLLAVLDRGVWRFPPWQFDPAGPEGVVRGLPAAACALRGSPVTKVSWFVQPNSHLGGRRPLDALKAGQIEEVEQAARAYGTT
jgi:Protein of unknown function (DUF2384)